MSLASAVDYLARNAFFLGALALCYLLGARAAFRNSLTHVSIGLGPVALDVHLDGFHYVIRSFPILGYDIESAELTHATRGQLARFHVAAAVALCSLAGLLVSGTFLIPFIERSQWSITERKIFEVDPHSAAAKAGLRPDFVIVEVDGRPIQSDFDIISAARKKDASLNLTVAGPKGPTRTSIRRLPGKADEKLGLSYVPPFDRTAAVDGYGRRALRALHRWGRALPRCIGEPCLEYLEPTGIPPIILSMLRIAAPLLACAISILVLGLLIGSPLITSLGTWVAAMLLSDPVFNALAGSLIPPLAAHYGFPIAFRI